VVTSSVSANNKAVVFRGRPQKEYARMPLESGKSASTISRNISELHTGKTFKRTKKKFGKKKAAKQAVAIALSKAREMPEAGHNPPKPTHAHVPGHMRGRGLISEKAMAMMGKHMASEAQRPSGPQVAAAGKSHAAHGDAKKAKPWKGHKLPGRASPEHGKHDAARAHSDEERTRKGPKGKMTFGKMAGHNPPVPTYSATGESIERPGHSIARTAQSQLEESQRLTGAAQRYQPQGLDRQRQREMRTGKYANFPPKEY
jgi:hypothetical protein